MNADDSRRIQIVNTTPGSQSQTAVNVRVDDLAGVLLEEGQRIAVTMPGHGHDTVVRLEPYYAPRHHPPVKGTPHIERLDDAS